MFSPFSRTSIHFTVVPQGKINGGVAFWYRYFGWQHSLAPNAFRLLIQVYICLLYNRNSWWMLWASSWQNQQNGMCAQGRLWSDWADAQADLSLCWAHSHFVGFVTRRVLSFLTPAHGRVNRNLSHNTVSIHFCQVESVSISLCCYWSSSIYCKECRSRSDLVFISVQSGSIQFAVVPTMRCQA